MNIPYTNAPSEVHGLPQSFGFGLLWTQRAVHLLAQGRCYQATMIPDEDPHTRGLLGLKYCTIHVDLVPWQRRIGPLATVMQHRLRRLEVGYLKLIKQQSCLLQNCYRLLSCFPLSYRIPVKPHTPSNFNDKFQQIITHPLNEL